MKTVKNASIRMRLTALAVVVGIALIACVGYASSGMGSVSSKSKQVADAQGVETQIATAYQQWLLDDDQSNMYAAVIALNDPAQHSLAETTFGQAEDGYHGAVKALSDVQSLITSGTEKTLVARISADIADYNHYTDLMRAHALKGDVQATIHVMTVENLKPSNDLPIAFEAINDLEHTRVAKLQAGIAHQSNQTRSTLIGLGLTGIALVALALWLTARSITRPIAVLQAGLDDMVAGDGDLTRRLESARNDELGRVANAFNAFVEKLQNVIAAIGQSSQSLTQASSELATVSQEMAAAAEQASGQAASVSAATEQISANVSAVSASAEEMGASISEIARNASDAARVAGDAVAATERTSVTVDRLGESSQQIGTVVQLISAIAEQTNLLALNATIEAARAGDAGKGFAVVASEVKDLARQTAEATEQIGHNIETIQNDASSAVTAIGEINEVISQINGIQTAIAAAVEEQSVTTGDIGRSVTEAALGSSEITNNVTQVAEAARATSGGAHQAQEAAGNLAGLAEELDQLVRQFRY